MDPIEKVLRQKLKELEEDNAWLSKRVQELETALWSSPKSVPTPKKQRRRIEHSARA